MLPVFLSLNVHVGCSFSFTYLDNEPPSINGCPDDAIIPAASTIPVPHSWVPPVFSDNSGQSVDVGFDCLATMFNECHQDGYGTFSVGDTEVMYFGTDTSGNQNFCNFTITVKGALKILQCCCYFVSPDIASSYFILQRS